MVSFYSTVVQSVRGLEACTMARLIRILVVSYASNMYSTYVIKLFWVDDFGVHLSP